MSIRPLGPYIGPRRRCRQPVPKARCAQLTAAKTARVPRVRSSTQCPQRASNYEEPASSGLLPLTIERLEEPRTAAILRPVAHVTKLLLSPEIR